MVSRQRRLAREESDDVRIYAAKALTELGPEARDGIQVLIEVLGDESDDIDERDEAARALGVLGSGSSEAVAALRESIMDPDGDIRKAASRGLAIAGAS